MTAPLDAARDAAHAVMERAYAPYSGFRVGAALVGASGTVFVGCNVENASFPAGICAERAALMAAVAAGERKFAALVVVSEAQAPTPPCGVCRQMLVEFAPALPIRSMTRGGLEAGWRLDELFPEPFTPTSLQHA